MKNRLNVIKISGLTGMFLVVMLIGCAIEGIVVFPSKVLMHVWNFIAGYIYGMPQMELAHGILLWAIVALSAYGIFKDKSPISYHSPNIVSEDELKEIIENARKIESVSPIIKEENSEQEIKH